MLTFHLSSKRKFAKKAYVHQLEHKPATQTPKETAVLNAFDQRDVIIRDQAKLANYKPGDLVRPIKTEDFNQYGYGRVRGIVSCYKDWPATAEFPKAPEVPMITLVEGLDRPVSYSCTVHFVRPLSKTESDTLNDKS